MRKEYIQLKGCKIFELWECNWCGLYRTDATVINHLRANFPYQRPLSEERLLQKIKSRKLYGYVQCDLKIPVHLKACFANFPPIFINTVVSRNDIGDLMKEYAEKEEIMSQPRRMLISSFHLKNGTIITPLLLYYLHLGLECTKFYRFVQYTPKKCFNSFVQSAVNARRQRDENLNPSLVAETMKLLANSSYGYQIMDRSRHTVTKYLNDGKTHSAINNKLFKQLNFITDQLYEVELVKSENVHPEPIIIGFFILEYDKIRMLELYYNSFKKIRDTEKCEELEMDTDSLYLARSEENLEDNIHPDKQETNGKQYVREIAQIASQRMQQATSSQQHVVLLTRSMIRDSRDCLKKNSGVPKGCACVEKLIVATIERVTRTNSVARDYIKELWKTVELDPCQSIGKC